MHPSTIESTPGERARHIKLLLCDVDGVLTDGKLIYLPDGVEAKAFSTLDGMGIRLLQRGGIRVHWITARESEVVLRRAKELDVGLNQGARDKRKAFEEVSARYGMRAEQVAFIGDDLLDLPALIRAGFACTVPGAPEIVRQRCHWTATREGGNGAVRELAEFILQAQGKLDDLVAEYLR